MEIKLTLFFVIDIFLCKFYNETISSWTETNCNSVTLENPEFSPININTNSITCQKNLYIDFNFAYSDLNKAQINLSRDPLTIRATVLSDFARLVLITEDKITTIFNSVGFVFRTPAEHTINSERNPIELQIEFKKEIGNNNIVSRDKIFVSFLFENNETNDSFLFTDYVNFLNGVKAETILNSQNGDSFLNFNVPNLKLFNSVIKKPINFYYYFGSRTDSACENGFQWFILQQRFYYKEGDLSVFKALLRQVADYDENGRVLNELEYETVVYSGGQECDNLFLNMIWFLIFYALINFLVFKVI